MQKKLWYQRKKLVLLDQYLAYSMLQIFGSSSWLPHSSLEVPLGISLQSESDRREIKVEVHKSHFSVDAEEIVVSPVTPCGLKPCKRARQSLGNCCSYFGNLDLHHRENNPGSVM